MVGSTAIDDLSHLDKEADIYIMVLADDQVQPVAEQLDLGDRVLVHTSGSLPESVLAGGSSNYGVLYPLQTFTQSKPVDFSKIPVFIQGNNAATLEKIRKIAATLSPAVHHITDEKRLHLHLAAVFVNNFPNQLYAIAANILSRQDLPFDLLRPLIDETTAKVSTGQPADQQTGPAKRGDQGVMEQHLALLEGHEDYRELYRLFSRIIQSEAVSKGSE